MNQAVEVAREFFSQLDTPTSGELIQTMDIFIMMSLIKFGERMSKEAKILAIKNKLLGNELEANAIAKDVSVIQKNLNALTQAYTIAMN